MSKTPRGIEYTNLSLEQIDWLKRLKANPPISPSEISSALVGIADCLLDLQTALHDAVAGVAGVLDDLGSAGGDT
jgi:hypothetical protein